MARFIDNSAIENGVPQQPAPYLPPASAPSKRIVLDGARSAVPNRRIGRDDGQVEDRSRCNNRSVERIAREILGQIVRSRRDGWGELQKVHVLGQPRSKEVLQGTFEREPTQPVKNRRFQQAGAAQALLFGVFNQAPNASGKGVGQRDAVDPRRRVEQVSHLRPFHSEAGIGPDDTAFFWSR